MYVWIEMVGGWRDVCLDTDGEWVERCTFGYRWWVGGEMYVWIEMGGWRDVCLDIDGGWVERCMFGYRWVGEEM